MVEGDVAASAVVLSADVLHGGVKGEHVTGDEAVGVVVSVGDGELLHAQVHRVHRAVRSGEHVEVGAAGAPAAVESGDGEHVARSLSYQIVRYGPTGADGAAGERDGLEACAAADVAAVGDVCATVEQPCLPAVATSGAVGVGVRVTHVLRYSRVEGVGRERCSAGADVVDADIDGRGAVTVVTLTDPE